MSVILTAFNVAVDAVMVLCLTFVAMFIFLAYFEPMILDTLVSQAKDAIPYAIHSVAEFIKHLINKIV